MHEPVTITDLGHDRLVLLSASEYKRLKGIDDILAGRRAPVTPDEDPLAEVFGQIHAKVEASGLTIEEIDAELNAYNAEHRL